MFQIVYVWLYNNFYMERSVLSNKSILSLFHPLSRLYRSEFKSNGTKLKVTFSQYSILVAVHAGTEQVGKLADHCSISQPAMSKMVDHLVKASLLKRIQNVVDRRQSRLELTGLGLHTIETIEKTVSKRITAGLSDYSPSEQQLIAKGVDKLIVALSLGSK